MPRLPFLPRFENLPGTIPVFPLPGALVMPDSELPLNIFEPRYLNMIGDALRSHRLIGMIQPDQAPTAGNDALSTTGCAGRITQYRETDDGRIELVLTGVCRFDIEEELLTTRGYRLVKPNWTRFADDCRSGESEWQGKREFLDTLQRYLRSKDLKITAEQLDQVPQRQLLNSLTCALPLTALDKQALLETVDDTQRGELFVGLLRADTLSNPSSTRH